MCARGYLLYTAPQDISEAVFFLGKQYLSLRNNQHYLVSDVYVTESSIEVNNADSLR